MTAPAPGRWDSFLLAGGAGNARPSGRAAGESIDSSPLQDKTRRSIAYLLVALLPFLVIALLAMVVFGAITVGKLEEFDVFLGPLVALVSVSGAIGYYYVKKRNM